jgi:sodium transport system permease protein
MNDSGTGIASRWRARTAIARRDLLEFVRDRRAVFITLVMPMAMYPLLAMSSTLGVRTALNEIDRNRPASRLTLALSGPDAEAFAGLVAVARDRTDGRPLGWPESLTIYAVEEDDAKPLVDAGDADAWIPLAPGTIKTLSSEGTVTLKPRFSSVHPPGRSVREHITAVLRGVADLARRTRLRQAGLPADLLEPIRIEFTAAASASHASGIRDVLPTAASAVFVLLALLTATGAFYPAIDAIAGEKERGTIETLLIAPCAPVDVVAGKFIAVFVVTLVTLLANAVSIALTATVLVRLLPADALSGLPPMATLSAGGIALVVYVGLAAVAAALCLTVTAAAKSAKEAQNTLTPVVMLIAALAGSAILPGADTGRWVPALPFAGHVAVARAALSASIAGASAVPRPAEPAPSAADVALGLGISLISSAAVTWLLLQLTATLLTDEDILFRGPDAASRGFTRPPVRPRPSPGESLTAAVAGLAALWYTQGLAPDDIVSGLVAQQALAVLLPLAVLAWWQRVDARGTFAVNWPSRSALGTGAVCIGAALIGVGLFVTGAAVALATWGQSASPELRDLAERLISLVRSGPAWRALLLLAVMPAVCEEILFRGWVLAGLAGPAPSLRRALVAVIVQAALFAAFHLLPERMPQTFAVGIVLGWLTLRTRSLLPAIVVHAAHNATPALLVIAASDADLGAIQAGRPHQLPAWAIAVSVGFLLGGAWLVAIGGRRRPLGTTSA